MASIFAVVPPAGRKLVVSGDGRYWNDVAIQKILRLAAGYGVTEVVIGQYGLLSTPAISHLIRKINEAEPDSCIGAVLLTASHNPAGPDEDFGIKFNAANGGPAPESVTDAVYEHSKSITEFKSVASLPDIDLAVIAETQYSIGESNFCVQVIDNTDAYTALMKSLFDFEQIRSLLQRSDFSILFDGMHGVAGPYARRVFVEELGVDAS